MNILFLILTFVSLNINASEIPHSVEILRVIDGDTIVIKAPWVPAPMKPEISVRVMGVDTPEHGGRAQCDLEAKNADEAILFTKNKILQAQKHEVIFYQWDKFGGRILGEVLLDDQRLSDMLIKEGHAHSYHGEKKTSWCN